MLQFLFGKRRSAVTEEIVLIKVIAVVMAMTIAIGEERRVFVSMIPAFDVLPLMFRTHHRILIRVESKMTLSRSGSRSRSRSRSRSGSRKRSSRNRSGSIVMSQEDMNMITLAFPSWGSGRRGRSRGITLRVGRRRGCGMRGGG